MNEKPLLLVLNYGGGQPEFTLADERDLAEVMRNEQYGSDAELHGVYAMNRHFQPVPVLYTVEGKYDFDENSWAHPLVTVTMPDGTKLQAHYTIDGRA
jgi:hypothetical protein